MAKQFGRRPPKNAPALRFASFRAAGAGVPEHPATVDYLSHLRDWQMLGNDVAGDCNAVTWANMRRLVTATLSTENYPTQAQVWQFYRTQNPLFDPNGGSRTGPGSECDQGMEIQSGLEYLHKYGGPDGVKPIAFAKVDPSNIDEVEAAIAIFGGLWLGVVVLQANMDEVDKGTEWTDVQNSPVDGGHAILAGGYTPHVKFITWGEETAFDPTYWNGMAQGQRLVEEAWVVVWPEHLGSKAFLEGVDLGELQAAYQALTGKVMPVPAPDPEPTPEPVPNPEPTPSPTPAPAPTPTSDVRIDSADRELAAFALSWTDKLHVLDNRRMKTALTKWLKVKGF